jgi:hypothetical protein
VGSIVVAQQNSKVVRTQEPPLSEPPRRLPLRLLGEGVVIIVSILLAFSLDAWWNDQQRRTELDEMLVLLGDELQRNILALEASIEVHQTIQDDIASIVETGSTRGVALGIVLGERFDPATGVLDALVSSGMLRDLRDSDLRVAIASLDALLLDLSEKEQRAMERRELVRNRAAGLGVRIGVFRNTPGDTPTVGAIPPDHPSYTDPELLNLMFMRSAEEGHAIDSAKILLNHMELLRDKLSSRE